MTGKTPYSFVFVSIQIAFCAVDCTKAQSLCKEFDISGYPTIKYFSFGKFVADYESARTVRKFNKHFDREKEDFIVYWNLNSLLGRSFCRVHEKSRWRIKETTTNAAIFKSIGLLERFSAWIRIRSYVDFGNVRHYFKFFTKSFGHVLCTLVWPLQNIEACICFSRSEISNSIQSQKNSSLKLI